MDPQTNPPVNDQPVDDANVGAAPADQSQVVNPDAGTDTSAPAVPPATDQPSDPVAPVEEPAAPAPEAPAESVAPESVSPAGNDQAAASSDPAAPVDPNQQV